MLFTRDSPWNKRSIQAESEWMEKIFQTSGLGKKAGVTILTSHEIDFKTKAITRDKEDHYIILKGVIQKEDIRLVIIHGPNKGAPKYIGKLLKDFKKEISKNTVIMGHFNTLLSTMDRVSRQKINKDIVELNDILDPMDN